MPITGGGGSATNPFITNGTSGVTTIRWQTTGGYVYDMIVTDAGAVLTTLISSPGSNTGKPIGTGWFMFLTYS